jgi:acyl-CoA synthetase (AMP-forming)/AMP-acid ligase II
MDIKKRGVPGTTKISCQSGGRALPEWRELEPILADDRVIPWNRIVYFSDFNASSRDLAFLSFTSGTTFFAEGLFHHQSNTLAPMEEIPTTKRICISTACHRAIQQGTVLWAWFNGGSVVMPAPNAK